MSIVIEVDTSDDPYLGSLQWGGFVWSDTGNAGDHVTIEYFIDNGPSAWSGVEIAGLQNALQSWANVANISFERVFSAAAADLVEQSVPDSTLDGAYGQHDVPEDAASQGFAVGQYNYEAYGWDHADPNGGLSIGGNGYWTLIHELGHALGLAHPHDDGGGSTLFPGVSTSGDTGTNGLNQGVWTVMSYLATQGPSSANTEGNGEFLFSFEGADIPNWGYFAGPMAFDIAAIQALYGANTSFQGGNSTYTLPDDNGLGTYWTCIWDTGGTDRIVYGGTRDVTISLLAATLDGSDAAAGVLSYADGIFGGYTIAHGVVIENAYAGRGDDDLEGNAASNSLYGRAGADVLRGLGGGDSLYGGLGADRHIGGNGAGIDYARYDDANYGDLVIRLSGAGNTGAAAGDTYVGMEGIAGGAGSDDITGDSARNYLLGGAGADSLRGGAGNDYLDGGAGADNLYGGLGADRHLGGEGFDYARYDDGNYGNLVLDLGNSALNTGAARGDTYSGIEGLVGGGGNDTITGDGARNYLYGLGGSDRLDGKGGNDVLIGGTGARDDYRFSTALGAGNVDTIQGFEDGLDKIVLSRAIFAGIGATLDANEFGAAADPNNFIIYDQATGRLLYDEGGSGDAPGPVHFATVAAGTLLDAGDFLMMA